MCTSVLVLKTATTHRHTYTHLSKSLTDPICDISLNDQNLGELYGNVEVTFSRRCKNTAIDSRTFQGYLTMYSN